MHDPAEPMPLDRLTCLRLLATGAVGRVIFTDGSLPTAQPVGYHLEGEEVFFRAPDGGKLAGIPDTVVAFEVDDVDPATLRGWAVTGVGQAYEVIEPGRLAVLAQLLPAVSGRTVSIPLEVISGHRYRDCAAPAVEAPPGH